MQLDREEQAAPVNCAAIPHLLGIGKFLMSLRCSSFNETRTLKKTGVTETLRYSITLAYSFPKGYQLCPGLMSFDSETDNHASGVDFLIQFATVLASRCTVWMHLQLEDWETCSPIGGRQVVE